MRGGSKEVIREANISEIDRLAPLAEEFASESRHVRKLNVPHYLNSLKELIQRRIGTVFLLVDGSDNILGTIGGCIFPDPLTGESAAIETHWFVGKEWRGGIGAGRLYRAFEAWARSRGCAELQFAHLEDSMPEEVARFYKRAGFEHAETKFVKRLEAA